MSGVQLIIAGLFIFATAALIVLGVIPYILRQRGILSTEADTGEEGVLQQGYTLRLSSFLRYELKAGMVLIAIGLALMIAMQITNPTGRSAAQLKSDTTPLIFIGACFGVAVLTFIYKLRWKVTVTGGQISYHGSLGQRREYSFRDITRIVMQNDKSLQVYSGSTRIFTIDSMVPAKAFLEDAKKYGIQIAYHYSERS